MSTVAAIRQAAQGSVDEVVAREGSGPREGNGDAGVSGRAQGAAHAGGAALLDGGQREAVAR